MLKHPHIKKNVGVRGEIPLTIFVLNDLKNVGIMNIIPNISKDAFTKSAVITYLKQLDTDLE